MFAADVADCVTYAPFDGGVGADLRLSKAIKFQRLVVLVEGFSVISKFVVDQTQVITRRRFQNAIAQLVTDRDGLIEVLHRCGYWLISQ